MEGLSGRKKRDEPQSFFIHSKLPNYCRRLHLTRPAILPRSFQFRPVSLPTTLSNLSQFHLRDCILSRGSLRDGRFDPLYLVLDYEAKRVSPVFFSRTRGGKDADNRAGFLFVFLSPFPLPLSSSLALLNS